MYPLVISFATRKAEDDAEEGEAAEPAKKKGRMTKDQLYKAYAGKGPTAMVTEFLLDEKLRERCLTIVMVTQPLEDQYGRDLKAQTKGLGAMLEWNYKRTVGSETWYKTAQDIVAVPYSPRFTERLGLTSSCVPPIPTDSQRLWVYEETESLENAVRFANALAGHVVWAHMLHKFAFPGAVCLVLAPSQAGLCVKFWAMLRRVSDLSYGAFARDCATTYNPNPAQLAWTRPRTISQIPA